MRITNATNLWASILVLAVVLPAARGVWLDLPSTGPKCVSEQINSKVVVLCDYYAFIGDQDDLNNTIHPTITTTVTSPYGNQLHHNEKANYGQFAFTTTEAGYYIACFTVDSSDNHPNKNVTVGIEWRTGISAKDWDSVAKKENIEGLELELKKLEENVNAVHQNLLNLVIREWEMRQASERMNARVALFGMMSLGICTMVSGLQILYLRRYFRKKKLI